MKPYFSFFIHAYFLLISNHCILLLLQRGVEMKEYGDWNNVYKLYNSYIIVYTTYCMMML